MNDAQRWRDAMHALGLEWRVGMVDVDGDVARRDVAGEMMINGCPVDWEQNFQPLSAEHQPDPHHPSNLGHLIAMVCELHGVDDVRWAFVRHGDRTGSVCIWSDEHQCRTGSCLLGKAHVERWEDASIEDVPSALLDALERKAREGA